MTKKTLSDRRWSFADVRPLSMALLLFALIHQHVDVLEATDKEFIECVSESLDLGPQHPHVVPCPKNVKFCLLWSGITPGTNGALDMSITGRRCDNADPRYRYCSNEEKGLYTRGKCNNEKVVEIYVCCRVDHPCYQLAMSLLPFGHDNHASLFPPALHYPTALSARSAPLCHECMFANPNSASKAKGLLSLRYWCLPEQPCYAATFETDDGYKQIRSCWPDLLPERQLTSSSGSVRCLRTCGSKRSRVCSCHPTHGPLAAAGGTDDGLPCNAEKHMAFPSLPDQAECDGGGSNISLTCLESATIPGISVIKPSARFTKCQDGVTHCIALTGISKSGVIYEMSHCDEKNERISMFDNPVAKSTDNVCYGAKDELLGQSLPFRDLCDDEGKIRENYKCCSAKSDCHLKFPPVPHPSSVCTKCRFESPGEQSYDKWCPSLSFCYAMVTVDVRSDKVERFRDCDRLKLPAPLVCNYGAISCLRVCGEKKRSRVCCCFGDKCNSRNEGGFVADGLIRAPTKEECRNGGVGPDVTIVAGYGVSSRRRRSAVRRQRFHR